MNKINGAVKLMEAAKNTLSPGGTGSKLDSTDIAQAIASGSQIARDKVYYIRSKQAAASGQQQILDEAVSKERGVTNFDKGAIRKSSAMIVTGLRVASNANASLTAAKYSAVITDAAITNGEIYITDNNGKELYSGPIAPMLPAGAPLKPGDDFFELDQPILLQPGQTVKIDIFFPDATAANTNVEVSLKGVENQAR
tara:strand:+ start:15377 stop:15967 length:591 start_codon:yes stop_codon:yes gene_type:complete